MSPVRSRLRTGERFDEVENLGGSAVSRETSRDLDAR
jgi:hypothetical protein